MPVSLLRRALTIGVMLATCGMTSNTLATTASRGTVALVMQTDGPNADVDKSCLLYTSPSPRDQRGSRMPSSA